MYPIYFIENKKGGICYVGVRNKLTVKQNIKLQLLSTWCYNINLVEMAQICLILLRPAFDVLNVNVVLKRLPLSSKTMTENTFF